MTPLLMELDRQTLLTPSQTALLIVAGQVVTILSLYLASKILAVGEKSTLLSAVRVWVLHLLLYVGAALFYGAVIFAMMAAGLPGLLAAVSLLALLLLIIGIIKIPMDVYEIGAFRAIGVLIATAIISSVAGVGASYAMDQHPERMFRAVWDVGQLPPAQKKDFFNRLRIRNQSRSLGRKLLDGEEIARDSVRPLPERAQALKRMYQDLEVRRLAVKPGDEVAKDAYDQQKFRYEELLASMKAEAERNRAEAGAR